jgi:hypothetical protein
MDMMQQVSMPDGHDLDLGKVSSKAYVCRAVGGNLTIHLLQGSISANG